MSPYPSMLCTPLFWLGQKGERGGGNPPGTSKKVFPPRKKNIYYSFPYGRRRRPIFCYFNEIIRKTWFFGKTKQNGHQRQPKENFSSSFPPGGLTFFYPRRALKPLLPRPKFPKSPPRWPTNPSSTYVMWCQACNLRGTRS